MIDHNKTYNKVIDGEIKIIHEELDNLCQAPHTNSIDVLTVIENISPHLASIEQKIGKSSIDHINICTEIVDVISNRMLTYLNNVSSTKNK